MKVRIISHTENPELVVATAAKLCYAGCNIDELMEKQTPEGIERFISVLESMGHESPMEHVSFTFAIEGVSRVTEQQLTRHRIASYSIQSGRYVDRSNASFYIPEDIEGCNEALEAYTSIIEHAKDAYESISRTLIYHMIVEYAFANDIQEILGLGPVDDVIAHFRSTYGEEYKRIKKKAIENARFVFPNSLQTKIICTMNVRTLLNFFKHRCCNRAQEEIKALAKIMLKEVRVIAPNLFRHAGAACASGVCPENSMQCSQLAGCIPTMQDVRSLIAKYYKKEMYTATIDKLTNDTSYVFVNDLESIPDRLIAKEEEGVLCKVFYVEEV